MRLRPLSRRAFLLAAGSAAVGLAAAGTDAFTWAPRRVQLNRHDVPVPALPAPLDGFKVAHLSDIHLYDGLHPAALRAMELTSEAAPDLTIVTGDLIEHLSQLPVVRPLLEACRGRLATIVTMGNWEYQAGATPGVLARECEAAGAAFLYNESLNLDVGAARLGVVGLDDPRAGIPDPERALRSLAPGAVPLWAFHAPGYADQLMAYRLPRPELLLTGHTHGGQIRPPFLPAITPPASGRFVSGWYRDSFGPLYVSRGIGTSGIRARFRCPPEVGLFTFRRA